MERQIGLKHCRFFRFCDFAVDVLIGMDAPVWVAAGVDFGKGVDVDMGVNLSRFHADMTEHFLNVADVSSAAMHVGGATVAEEMTGAGFIDAAAFHEFFHPVTKVGR